MRLRLDERSSTLCYCTAPHAATNAATTELVAYRIQHIRKWSKTMLFVDLLHCPSGAFAEACLKSPPLSAEQFARAREAGPRPGDVVTARGVLTPDASVRLEADGGDPTVATAGKKPQRAYTAKQHLLCTEPLEVVEAWPVVFGSNSALDAGGHTFFACGVNVVGDALARTGLDVDLAEGGAITGAGRDEHPLLALQCHKPFCTRLAEYLRGSLRDALRDAPLRVTFRASEPIGKCSDRILLLRAAEAAEEPIRSRRPLSRTALTAALFASVGADPVAGKVLRRAYAVAGPCHSTLAGATAAVVRQLRAATAAAVVVRVQCFPKSLEPGLAAAVRACGDTGAAIQLHSVLFTHVVSVVFARGGFYVGVVSAGLPPLAPPLQQPGGWVCRFVLGDAGKRTASVSGGGVCRAFFKLKEAWQRAGFPLPLRSGAAAIDLGASPGGWSSFLAGSAGCRRVVAVDPGLLAVLPAPGGPPSLLPPAAAAAAAAAIEHMRMGAAEALGLLLRSEAATKPWADALVCDVNMPPAAVVGFLGHALPLLRPGACIVITFKNTFAKRKAWEAAVVAQSSEMARVCCAPIRQIHLIANTSNEITV
eukprot:g170.t1